MTPEERSLLENTHQLAKENNELLHAMKRRARLGTAVKVFYWAVIIGLSFGAIYFIQPYVDMLKGLGGSSATPNSSNGSKDANNSASNFAQQIQDLLK